MARGNGRRGASLFVAVARLEEVNVALCVVLP
jgi:hypothetical protein